MSLQIEFAYSVPQETAWGARAAFSKGKPFMKMRDLLGTLFAGKQLTKIFPPQGQSAEAPWRPTLTLGFQFAEGLSDRQKATLPFWCVKAGDKLNFLPNLPTESWVGWGYLRPYQKDKAQSPIELGRFSRPSH